MKKIVKNNFPQKRGMSQDESKEAWIKEFQIAVKELSKKPFSERGQLLLEKLQSNLKSAEKLAKHLPYLTPYLQ